MGVAVKDVLRAELASNAAMPGRDVIREYLQVRLLQGLQEAGASADMAFHGGTALRLLFRTPRFSEDLDFAVLRTDDAFDLGVVLREVRYALVREGYDVEIALKTTTAVHKAVAKFRGLLYEMRLSPLRDEVMMIKLEVDTNPPPGATVATSRLPRGFGVPVRVVHHDRATLLAGKIAAVLTREWVKGRDVFDLVWYAGNAEWPVPNLSYLNAAVAQSGWSGAQVTVDNWRGLAWERLTADAQWETVRRDVERFALAPGVVDMVSPEAVREALFGR